MPLSDAQKSFAISREPFPAFVGGFGCVDADTKIWTEFGLIRIADINRPMRVLSWSEKDQRFQLSLSGGSFPKGRENLIRVQGPQGGFAGALHHRIFSSRRTYEQLASQHSDFLFCDDHLGSIVDICLRSSPSDDLHCNQTISDLMGCYASEARRYGQQFLCGANTDQVPAPSLSDAHKQCQSSYLSSFEHLDDQLEQIQGRNHHDQFFCHKQIARSLIQKMILGFSLGHQIQASFFEHISRALESTQQFASRFLRRHTIKERIVVSDSCWNLSNVSVSIIKDTGEERPYYDLQVLNTNNYICEAGFIHHNSGKTAAAIARAMALKSQFKDCDVAYYLPTYPLVEDIALRRFPELCERKGWAYRVRGGNSPHIEFPGSGRIVFRTMERPERIVGYEVAHSILDELDTLPLDKARDVWNKVIARNRQKCKMANTVAVATTPEGFRFVYERWVKDPSPGYVMFKAKTLDNARNLPEGYIDNLTNSYSSNLLAAYLDGEFVNLTSGSVYPEFDRKLNASTETIQQGEVLHVGMDFNVTNMSAVIHVLRKDEPHAVTELTGIYDTPTMAQVLKDKFQGHRLMIYPDASGNARKTVNASESDHAILRSAGFQVCVNGRNPRVKDRILSVNHMINAQGIRRYLVNPETCPSLVESLEKQSYDKNGEPDKKSGFDHVLDAAGYFIVYRYPMMHNRPQFAQIVGI